MARVSGIRRAGTEAISAALLHRSARMPSYLTSLPIRTISARMNKPNSSGVLLPTSYPPEGETLSELLSSSDRPLPWNVAFSGHAVATRDDRNFFEVPAMPGYPRIRLLSPTPERLAKLLPWWDKELERLRRRESNPEEEREATPSKFPDLEALAAHKPRPDRSLTNGSSIAILLEHQGTSALLAADAFATDLFNSLLALAEHRHLLTKDRRLCHPLRVNAFKLSHHGSRGNLKNELFGVVEAKDYIVCTDAGHGLPNDEALARAVRYGGDVPALWFNYATERNVRWADRGLQTKHTFESHFPEEPGQGVTVVCRA